MEDKKIKMLIFIIFCINLISCNYAVINTLNSNIASLDNGTDFNSSLNLTIDSSEPQSIESSSTIDSSSNQERYVIIWQNYDGTILEVDNNVFNGTLPIYDGPIPQKESDSQYYYEFKGWNPKIVPATRNATYTAQFEPQKKDAIISNLMFDNYSKDVKIYDDNSKTLFLNISPSSYDYNASLNKISWTSSNPEIVSIFSEESKSAIVAAHNIPGTVTITASTKNGVSCSTSVTVELTELNIYSTSTYSTISSITLSKNQTYMITTNMKAKFKSLNPDVAVIDSDGTIKALKIGVANIEVESISNGTKKLLEVKVFDLTIDYPHESLIDNYYLYSTGQIGSSYARCNVSIADVYVTGGKDLYGDYDDPNGLTIHAKFICKKVSGLTGPHKVNVYIYNSDGNELDKTTLKTNDIAVGETDEFNADFCLSESTIDYSETLKIELYGVAW